MACCCELSNTLDVEVTQDALLDVEIGGSAGVLLQAKSVDVTENGTSVVAPDDGFDGLKSVEINTNVPKRLECGDAVFDTSYNGGRLYQKITKANVSCIVKLNTTNLSYLFQGFYSIYEIIGCENWDTSNVTNFFAVFADCRDLKYVYVSGWNTSKATKFSYLFNYCQNLTTLDFSGWDTSNVMGTDYMLNGCHSLRTIIGYNTLQDVENGIVSLRGMRVSISTISSPLRFSSILALANGLADLTDGTAQTLTISKQSYNNMYNDDDTTPTADVIAERQARIAAICAAKNWNFAH